MIKYIKKINCTLNPIQELQKQTPQHPSRRPSPAVRLAGDTPPDRAAEAVGEQQEGRGDRAGQGVGRETGLDFSEIKVFLGITKEEIKCLINGALETRLNSPKLQQK